MTFNSTLPLDKAQTRFNFPQVQAGVFVAFSQLQGREMRNIPQDL